MGKAQRQKRQASTRSQPTGLPSVKETEAQMQFEESSGTAVKISSTVSSLVEQLQSPIDDDRECACRTIASLVSQKGAIEQFMKADLIRAIGPLIIDKHQGVQETSLGVLRNVSVEGGHEVCEKMVEQDVMTPLVALFSQLTSTTEEEKMEESSQKKNNVTETSPAWLQAVHLLWNLCESSPIALDIFNKDNLLKVILPHVYNSEKNLPLAIVSAQCVYTVTDGNPNAVVALVNDGVPGILSNALSVQHKNNGELLLKTVIAGIINNIGPEGLNSAAGSVLSGVIVLLSNVLELEALSSIKQATSIIQGLDTEQEQAQATEISEDTETDGMPAESGGSAEEVDLKVKHKELENLIESTQQLVQSQQLAIEIIANMCCSREDEEWEEDNSEGSSDEFNVASMEEHLNDAITDSSAITGVPIEVHEAFMSNSVMKKVLSMSEPVDLSFCDTYAGKFDLDKVVKNMVSLQSRALLCLGNLVSGLEVADLGEEPGLLQIWSGLTQLATSELVKTNDEMLEAVTGALRAVVQKLSDLNSPKLKEVTENDLQFLCQIVQECKDPQIRVNALRIVSGFGCALAKSESVHPQLKNVGLFLIQIVTNDPDLWVIAEALDSIFDVFAEDETDSVLKDTQIIDTLKTQVPTLKIKIKQQKRRLGEHFPVVSTARTNLVLFINYKSQRL